MRWKTVADEYILGKIFRDCVRDHLIVIARMTPSPRQAADIAVVDVAAGIAAAAAADDTAAAPAVVGTAAGMGAAHTAGAAGTGSHPWVHKAAAARTNTALLVSVEHQHRGV
jgi:hypothetical protein